MKGYIWDFKEIKKERKTQPKKADIDYLYEQIVKGKDLRNSIKNALKEGIISNDFNLRSYIYHMNRQDNYKSLIAEKKETYKLNCTRVLKLSENFTITEIALITGFDYAYVFNITNK